MALLDILIYPDPRLRVKAGPVSKVDADIRQVVDDMAQTMYHAPGIGLAAIQVNVPKRIIVIDISEERNDLHVFINPEIVRREGEQGIEEGCLSLPGVFAPVTRSEAITVKALGREGGSFQLDADGLLAVCIQHEMDHLEGKVFVDYLSRLKQDRIRKRLQKQSRRDTEPQSAAAVL